MTKFEKKALPNGLWPSPVTAGLVSQRIRLDDVQWAGDGQTLVWTEGRSGGSVLVAQALNGARRDLTDEQTPRGGVGYGGGTYDVSRQSALDMLIFANRDGRLYRRGLGSERPYPITPPFGPQPAGSVASPAVSPDGRWVLYVYSDGKTDLLAIVGAEGQEWPIQLVRGADFYMSPVWSPDGSMVAWVEWDHPHMPWDETKIKIAKFEENPPRVSEIRTVSSGSNPAVQPMFSPDGRWLSFIEENGEWPSLILFDLESGKQQSLVEADGFELAPPAWVQGIRSSGWSPDGQRLYYFRQYGPLTSLWQVEIATGSSSQIDTAPYTGLYQLSVSPSDDKLTFIASGPDQPDCIVIWEKDRLRTVSHSTAATVDPQELPIPQEIHWQTSDDATAYGLYYPPSSQKFTSSELPPALLSIHGGPTSLAGNRFNAEAAYFTSRGFAYIVVNYRGSTGYGRSYRHAMRQRWGDVDVEDAVSCARFLGEQKMVDPGRIVITGGSAGGYTVLNSLIRYPGVFKAGICLYGVSNLFALDLDTHKFEAHYNASMVGKLPEAADRYRAWSPIFHAHNIKDALYIFQGSEDKVVPPNQSEEIVKMLITCGIPHKYKVYEGEGHGFRKAENISDYLKETERFLLEYVLFA
jgi:dipeptidyl aminopeptidase/acylaminoacyl peptidase